MSSMTLSPAAVSRPAINHWIVAIIVVVPTFMEILDTSIANVALSYIAGGLSSPRTDADWVITAYLAANASSCRSPAGSPPTSAGGTTSSSRSPCSPSPRRRAGSPPVWYR